MFVSMSGRKPIYDLKTLKIGSKMRLLDMGEEYADQYIWQFNHRETEVAAGRKYKKVTRGSKVFVERIA